MAKGNYEPPQVDVKTGVGDVGYSISVKVLSLLVVAGALRGAYFSVRNMLSFDLLSNAASPAIEITNIVLANLSRILIFYSCYLIFTKRLRVSKFLFAAFLISFMHALFYTYPSLGMMFTKTNLQYNTHYLNLIFLLIFAILSYRNERSIRG